MAFVRRSPFIYTFIIFEPCCASLYTLVMSCTCQIAFFMLSPNAMQRFPKMKFGVGFSLCAKCSNKYLFFTLLVKPCEWNVSPSHKLLTLRGYCTTRGNINSSAFACIYTHVYTHVCGWGVQALRMFPTMNSHYFPMLRVPMPITVAEWSKARVCGRSLAGIEVSNPAGGMVVSLL